MGFPLYVTCCFSLAAFNILSLCLVFVSLISMCLSMFLLGFILCLLNLIDYFLFHVEEIFNCNLFKKFLIPFLFLFLFWDPYNSMLVCSVLSQRSLRLSSILFILFTLFCSSEVISTILSFSLLIRSSASDILLLIPSAVIFNFSNCVVCLCIFIL